MKTTTMENIGYWFLLIIIPIASFGFGYKLASDTVYTLKFLNTILVEMTVLV